MAFRPGSRVGQYEIGPLLGAGGMGEVYRARDLTLQRDVAVKAVAGSISHVSTALDRFEREARLLASLNHPHVASIYGTIESGGTRAIVMELVEGPTLADRLSSGALPVADALAIAAEIAEAVEAAHDKGVVHRDLKPANIKFTANGAVKVLDFGIAKAVGRDAVALSEVPTVEATGVGTIVGTAAYMSPEQARGLAVDARTDVWAFGVIVYEMLAGCRAFDGATTSDVVAAVLTSDPDWSRLPSTVPPATVRLLQRCLERDPARRLKHIGAARYAIEDVTSNRGGNAPSTAGRATSRARSWTIAASFVAGAAVVAAWYSLASSARGVSPSPASAAILSMAAPGGEPLYLFAGAIALSPDGSRAAFVTNAADGKPRMWLRTLSAIAPEQLPGAAGGMFPFWSPDGKSLAFFADGQVKVAELENGTVRAVAPWSGPVGGGTWSRDGVIVFTESSGLKRVAAAGGPVTLVVPVRPSDPNWILAAPGFLPDGRHFVYYAGNARRAQGAIMVASLDGGEPRQVMPSGSMAVYAPPGYLLYYRSGEIVAQRFATDRFAVEGDPVVIAAGAWAWSTGGVVALSASDTGMIMFATRRSTQAALRLFDRGGRPAGTLGDAGEWVHVAVSPDDRTLAAEGLDPRSGTGSIWAFDIARNVASRLTPEPTWSLAPAWSFDGTRILYGASREGASDLYVKSAGGVGAEIPLLLSPELKVPTDWTHDGRIVFTSIGGAGMDIAALPEGGVTPAVLVATKADEGSGKVSPDGQWLAYQSNESGRVEVYVRALAGSGRWPVSRNGGWQPRWRRDGKELYFIGGDSTLMAARITASGARFSVAEPETLPIKVPPDVTGWRYRYDVLSLGQRFIAIVPSGRDDTPPIVAIPGWTALVRSKD